MRPLTLLLTTSLLASCNSLSTRPVEIDMPAVMQEYMMLGMPGEEHQELAKSVGNWKTTMRYRNDASEDWQEMSGSASYEAMFDGRFVIGRDRGVFDMEGQQFPHESMMIMGYDRLRNEWTSSYYSSMSTWSGELRGKKNADGVIEYAGIHYDTVTPEGRPSKAHSRWEGDDKMVFEMWDSIGGEMVHTMTWIAERQK